MYLVIYNCILFLNEIALPLHIVTDLHFSLQTILLFAFERICIIYLIIVSPKTEYICSEDWYSKFLFQILI